nr:hypothetical protein GCM10020093_083050 [Planobispora longispora]
MRIQGTIRQGVLLGLLATASLVPAFATLNRGMLLAVAFALAYAALRYAAKGHLAGLVAMVAAGVVGVTVAYLTGVADGITSRTSVSGSNDDRVGIYLEAFQRTLESPILGYGAPRPPPPSASRSAPRASSGTSCSRSASPRCCCSRCSWRPRLADQEAPAGAGLAARRARHGGLHDVLLRPRQHPARRHLHGRRARPAPAAGSPEPGPAGGEGMSGQGTNGDGVGAQDTDDRKELRSFAKGGVVTLLGSVGSAAAGFLMTVVVARLLGPAEAGVFFIVMALFMILSEVTELGADTGLVRSAARLRALGRMSDLRRVTVAALVPVLAVSTVTAVALYACAPWVASFFADAAHLDEATLFLRVAAPSWPCPPPAWSPCPACGGSATSPRTRSSTWPCRSPARCSPWRRWGSASAPGA